MEQQADKQQSLIFLKNTAYCKTAVFPQIAQCTDIHEQGVDLAFIDGDHSSACTLTDYLLLKDYLNINERYILFN